MSSCRALGCNQPVVGYGAYCAIHKARMRRHGHPDQRGVTKEELSRYVKRIQARILKNHDNPVWDLLDGRWNETVGTAESILANFRSGQPMPRHEVQAAKELVTLASAIEPREAVIAGLAMYLLQEANPHRFQSDDAFATQLVRRIRGLSEAPSQVATVSGGQRRKRYYRDLPPRVSRVLAGWLIPVVGPVGLKLAALDRQEALAHEEASKALQSAVNALR